MFYEWPEVIRITVGFSDIPSHADTLAGLPRHTVPDASTEEPLERLHPETVALEWLKGNGKMVAVIKTEHPYVTCQEGVCGGRPIVDGRRIPVWQIAHALRRGQSAEQIVDEYADRLTPAAVYDAISYYHDHRSEVDIDLENNTSDEALTQLVGELDAQRDERGLIRFGRPRGGA